MCEWEMLSCGVRVIEHLLARLVKGSRTSGSYSRLLVLFSIVLVRSVTEVQIRRELISIAYLSTQKD